MSWNGFNRRQFPRILYPCLVKIIGLGDTQQESILTHTENIGVGGICVIIKKEIPLFHPVHVEIDFLEDARKKLEYKN